MRYPLNLRLALAGFGAIGIGGPLVTVEDADGEIVARAEREDPASGGEEIAETVAVHAGEAEGERGRPLYRIRAEQITDDFGGVVWEIAGADGGPLGALTRHGAPSVWRASYEVEDAAGETVARATERYPWIKVVEGLPLFGSAFGALSEFVLNPAYELEMGGGRRTLLKKQPSLLERAFVLEEPEGGFAESEEPLLLPTAIMVALFERQRG